MESGVMGDMGAHDGTPAPDLDRTLTPRVAVEVDDPAACRPALSLRTSLVQGGLGEWG
jgi:hypothetical protein